jgi:hypothetical protein
MTRFRELKRIESAIEHKNEAELQWALGYCKMRLQVATMKHHEAYWRRIEKSVKTVLAEMRSQEHSN